ncbi:MAG: hypothetical protein GEU80_07450 [Dehalococcoidia bacterium]|nr:hypothetical protein [Dehalococcoidia bacterium]
MLPLDGITVLDLSTMYAGPGTATYLGDMGADVIKVEQPNGDDSRALGTSPFLAKNSRFYMAVNRNKRALSLDLQNQAGKDVLYRLVRDADIILHNFRPGVAERLAVDYTTLSDLNRGLIYVWMTGFGSRGPYAQKQAYDNIIQGYAGVYDSRMKRYGDPSGAGTFIADTAAPMVLGLAIGAALWSREHTGRGQIVECSLLGSALLSQASQWISSGRQSDREAPPEPEIPEDCCPTFACKDDQFLTVGLITDHEWRAFCHALGREGLADDERFAATDARARNRRDLADELAPLFLERGRDEWLGLLADAGVPSVPLTLRTAMKDFPQAVENDLFARIAHPTVGSTVHFNVPVQLSETPGTIRRPAPMFGEHTDEILQDAGYSVDEIRDLHLNNVVA